MKPPGNDRERAIAEQCWLGIGFMLFWAVMIMGLFKACTHGREVNFSWNPNPPAERVQGYRLYRLGSPNLMLATTADTRATATAFPGEQVAVAAFNAAGESDLSAPVTITEPVPPAPLLDRTGWEIHGVSSMEIIKDYTPAGYAIDDDPFSFWHTEWATQPPHYLVIRLPRPATVSALDYLPRQDGGSNGHLTAYEVESSLDGITWEAWASGTWPATADRKTAALPLREIRFFRIWSRDRWAAAAEVELAGTYTPDPPAAVTLTVQQSPDLREWTLLHTLTVPMDAKQFFRLKIEP